MWLLVIASMVLIVMIGAAFRLYHECKKEPDDKVPREAFTREDDYFDKVLNEPHGTDGVE